MMLFRRALIRSSRFPSFKLTASVHTEAKLAEMGITLPQVIPAKGNYMSFVRTGNHLFLAGHLPQDSEGGLVKGKVGDTVSVEDAYAAARLTGVNICATLKYALGDLDKVKKIVKLVGFVNCTDTFTQQPAVINGCSDLMGEVFGEERGRHARSAVGTNSLPLGIAVEIEAVVEIEG
mmetsp:Transcript_10870/g.20080  ORF Transcript_10870/g.20080 Transcript_10870/m.20080 type:complete len:177 (-) Transcript_10870:218-748(-)